MFLVSLFFSLISSIFIPYEATETGKIGFLANESFNEVFQYERFMLLVVDENAREVEISKTSFAVASTTVSKKCEFAYISVKEIPEITEKIYLDLPYVIYFKKGEKQCAFDLPIEESLVISQINYILDGPTKIANSISDLNKFVSNLDYTIISRVQFSDDAYNLMIDNIEDMTTCGILLATNEVFNETGFDNENYLLFRRDDTVLLPFNGTSEGITDIIMPLYFQATLEDFQYDKGMSVVFMTPEYKESDTFHDIFLTFAEKYKDDFNFRIITEENFHIADRLLGRDLEIVPDTAIADITEGTYYDTHEFDGLEINETWKEKMTTFLDKIKAGQIEKSYLSEPIPTQDEIDQDEITRIVGKTFADFINDTEKDTFVMFGTKETYRGLDVLFNNIIHDLNMSDKVKFGAIDIFRNSHKDFPFLVQIPHIELYKKGENRETRKLFGNNDEKHYKLFIKENTDIDIEVEQLNEQECFFDKIYVNSKLQTYDNATKEEALRYIQRLEKICPSDESDENNNSIKDSTNEL